MPACALSEAQCESLKILLTRLAAEMEAEGLVLADYGGNVLVHVILDDNMTTQTLAALAAGSFSATRELARLINEKEFKWIFHRGHQTSIYMQCIASNYLLLALLGSRTTQGLVKLYVEKVSEELERILVGTHTQTVADTGQPQIFEIDDHSEVFKISK